MFRLTSLLAIAALTTLSVPSARAESVPPQCDEGWWIDAPSRATPLVDMPALPWIRIPILWSPATYDRAPPTTLDLAPERFSIEVRDELDVVVPGAVAVRTFPSGFDDLGQTPWWQPDTPLTPGATYSMVVNVAAPTPSESNWNCPHRAFEIQVTWTVALEAFAPAVDVVVYTDEHELPAPSDYFACTGAEGEVVCADYPRVCCVGPTRQYRRLIAKLTAVSPPGGLDAYSLIASFERPGAALEVQRRPFFQATSTATAMTQWLTPPGPPQADSECVLVELESFITEAVVFSVRVCAAPEDHVALPTSTTPYECFSLICQSTDGNLFAEPGPETAEVVEPAPETADEVESGPEPELEPGPETADEVEPGPEESDVAEVVDSSPHESAPGGCGAATTAVPWGVSIGLLMVLGWRRRRGGGAHFGWWSE